MAKRLLYLEDLYDFYSNTYKRSTRFNADDSGDPIVVHVHGKVILRNQIKTQKDCFLFICKRVIRIQI